MNFKDFFQIAMKRWREGKRCVSLTALLSDVVCVCVVHEIHSLLAFCPSKWAPRRRHPGEWVRCVCDAWKRGRGRVKLPFCGLGRERTLEGLIDGVEGRRALDLIWKTRCERPNKTQGSRQRQVCYPEVILYRRVLFAWLIKCSIQRASLFHAKRGGGSARLASIFRLTHVLVGEVCTSFRFHSPA